MTIRSPRFLSLACRCFVLCLTCASIAWPGASDAVVQRVKYQAAGNYVVVELLDDDLMHVEYGRGAGPAAGAALDTSPMVTRKDYPGPTTFRDDGRGVIETADIRLEVNRETLFLAVIDKTKANLPLTTISPLTLDQNRKGIEASFVGDVDLYGLGQQFVEPGNTDIDWERRVREGGEFGNVMGGFNGGANGNTQLPVLYVVRGASLDNYALFLDNTHKQRWDFTGSSKWKAEVFGGAVRFYVMTGRDLPDLRKDFMELVGHPLVPPKKMFGLWVSEYGYDRWAELDDKLTTLRRNNFPLDGFVLDLQWFGGIQPGSDNTRMGSLTWDTANFPNPAQKIADLRERQGVGIMLIEEAYVGRALPEHADLQGRGCLARRCVGCTDPAYIDVNPWWGKGGMIDYSSDACGDYLHDSKRLALIRDGVVGHWTDLGEPEMYKRDSGYAGNTSHADIHNIFNFKWLQSINRGYERSRSEQRPFMMSRSGTAGIQRFGAAMWSADIASRLSSLAAHAANQMHMSLSGIDYYGSDIGGFQRNLEGDLNDMYTRWYAFGMLFDIPGRPHVENLCNCKETAPDRIGDARSNLENTRLRYELIPYLYSLAHRAHRFAEPVAPPPVFYYQTDPAVRHLGRQKLLGRDLLAAASTRHDERETDVYLPGGAWFDWYSNQRFDSRGGMTARTPLYRDGLFRLPLFARQGAIVPMQHVDERTMNALGKRSDATVRDELVLKIFAGEEPSEFTLYEDDGQTIAYRRGEVRETRVTQQLSGEQVAVTVQGAVGSYAGAPQSRNNVIRLVANLRGTSARAKTVSLSGQALTQHSSLAAFNAADSGWFNDGGGRTIWIKSGVSPVASAKAFVVALEAGAACESQYRSISVPGEDNGWNPADPARTLSCTASRVWKGQIKMCGGSYKFVADGSWTRNWGANGQQDGPNFPPLKSAGIFDVSFDEGNPAQPSFTPVDQNSALCGVSARFVCANGDTTPGTSVYVVGNIPSLGNWNTDNAVKLNPDGPYPAWTGMIGGLPASTRIEWKCIKRLETGTPARVVQWQPGGNSVFTTPAAGDGGIQRGAF